MKKLGYILYQPYKWLIYVPFMVASTVFFSFMAAFTAIIVSPEMGSFFGKLWAKSSALFTPMFVKVEGKENIKKNQSYVIVANHQSQYDIFVLYGWLGIDFRWIMKKELRNAPFIGYASAKVGHIFIDRSSPVAAMKSIEEAKKQLINGVSVVIFPEGTRSRDGKMRRFKKGAFKIAHQLELPILPVTLVGTNKIMGSGFLNVMPGKVKLRIHPPIDVREYADKQDELMEKTRSVIEQGLKD
ncbi:MAG: 1-acyl-sn-glycerol-3-phosphate acyltransferase [Chlorobi bacterium]|nr:1-acyl-sn-glycerol-3-phosphate acyltransferase [Chlorobiota bacterium]